MGKLDGKVAVITGGNSGIGLATAKAFVDEGARVAIMGRDAETLGAALEQLGDEAIGFQGDVRNLGDLDRLYASVRDQLGAIDVLFVNAGVASMRPVEAVDEEDFDFQFDVNVKGAYFTVQKSLPLLNNGAAIVLNTSISNQLGDANTSVYSATKAALRSLARTLSAELVGRGIRVNAISPGPIETPIFGRLGLPEDSIDEVRQHVTERVPMMRMGAADEIAKAVVFLASDDSSFVLGHELVVDGGLTEL